jgi:hypothetical protein
MGERTMGKRSARSVVVAALAMIALAASAVPVAAGRYPVTYLNANFGLPNDTGIAFYRSKGSINFDSATASALAKAKAFEVSFSASSDNDPNETSSGFSSYDVGTVNVPGGGLCNLNTSRSLCSLTVSPRTLFLSGSAHFCMNLWFDSNHDGEYFDWENNQFTGLGGDAYAAGTCSTGTLTIDENTPLAFVAPGDACTPAATLETINSNGCPGIPPNTKVAMWIGIDIGAGTTGQGSANL